MSNDYITGSHCLTVNFCELRLSHTCLALVARELFFPWEKRMNERSSNSFSLIRRYDRGNYYSLAPTSTRILSFATVRSFKSLISISISTHIHQANAFFWPRGYGSTFSLINYLIALWANLSDDTFFFFCYLSFVVSKSEACIKPSSDIRTIVADSTPLIETLKPSLSSQSLAFAY